MIPLLEAPWLRLILGYANGKLILLLLNKNNHKQKAALAAGIRNAYAPLFAANENAHKLPMDQLKSLISQVAGTDADMSHRIASTFSALAKLADFDTASEEVEEVQR